MEERCFSFAILKKYVLPKRVLFCPSSWFLSLEQEIPVRCYSVLDVASDPLRVKESRA